MVHFEIRHGGWGEIVNEKEDEIQESLKDVEETRAEEQELLSKGGSWW